MPLSVAWLFPTELSFRLVGFFLQVLGVWIVWRAIRDTRQQFAIPGWWDETKALIASFPRLRGRTIAASVGIALGAVSVAGRAHGWHGVAEDAPIENRVSAIEKNLRNVRDELSAHQEESDDRARAHGDEMKRERAERESADNAIHEKIKETETGGLHLNWSGVWWLLSGTVCTTFPQELADAFARIRT